MIDFVAIFLIERCNLLLSKKAFFYCIDLETASALLAKYLVIHDRELKMRYRHSTFVQLHQARHQSLFDVVERGFPLVLVSRNKTAFSY